MLEVVLTLEVGLTLEMALVILALWTYRFLA